MTSLPPSKLVVLISGSGTTLVNLIEKIRAGELNAQIDLVIGSKANLKGLDRSAEANLPSLVVDPRGFADPAAFSQRIFSAIDQVHADLVCLAGWLHLLQIPARYEGKVLNIHPSLLPEFGGKGMYGLKVHQAVLDHKCTVTGCTVHIVDNAYDNGPIILQRTCPVLATDTPATVAARVFEEEKIAYPEAIRMIQAESRG